MDELVWDASALLMILNQEPGWERLVPWLGHGDMSTVNLSEVVAKLAEAGLSEKETRLALGWLPLKVHAFDSEQCHVAGLLRPSTKARGLSLGDRACLALAKTLDRPALTAERAWQGLRLDVEVRLAR